MITALSASAASIGRHELRKAAADQYRDMAVGTSDCSKGRNDNQPFLWYLDRTDGNTLAEILQNSADKTSSLKRKSAIALGIGIASMVAVCTLPGHLGRAGMFLYGAGLASTSVSVANLLVLVPSRRRFTEQIPLWGNQLDHSANIGRAERALHDIVAQGKPDSLRPARIGLAGSQAASESPAGRLRMLRATLEAIESGACGGAGFQTQLASNLVDAYDGRAHCPAPGRNSVIRAMLDEMAKDATPRAACFGYLAALSHSTAQPRMMLDMATRLESNPSSDVTEPSWYASVAAATLRSAAERAGENNGLLGVIDSHVPSLIRQRQDVTALSHLERRDRYAQLPLSADSLRSLAVGTYEMIGQGVPAAPESALILAHKVGLSASNQADMKVLFTAAVAEARQSTYPPANPTPAWLDYLEVLASIGDLPYGTWRLHEVLEALTQGKPASIDHVICCLEHLTADEAGCKKADKLLGAVVDLDRGDGSLRHAAQLSLRLVDAAAEPIRTHLLGTAFSRLEERMREEVVTFSLAASAAGDPRLMRYHLESCLRQDGDPMGQALYRAYQDPLPARPQHISQNEQFVLIGNLKVPKLVMQPGCPPPTCL